MFGLFKSKVVIKDYFLYGHDVTVKITGGKKLKYNLLTDSAANIAENLRKVHNVEETSVKKFFELLSEHAQDQDQINELAKEAKKTASNKTDKVEVVDGEPVKDTNKGIDDVALFLEKWIDKYGEFFINSRWTAVIHDEMIQLKDAKLGGKIIRVTELSKADKEFFKEQLQLVIKNVRIFTETNAA